MSNKFSFRILCRLSENVQKYGTAGQATDDNITRRMRFACWITKVTSTNSVYVILIAWQWEKWLRECASIFTVISALPLLSVLCLMNNERLYNIYYLHFIC
jgi:hypothetical protein